MPYRDKTGPLGKGPLTGRGMGDCSFEIEDKKETIIESEREFVGRGLGRGFGRGLGRGRFL